MNLRLSTLSFTTGAWRVRACDKRLSPSGPATHVAIERTQEGGGYVVAYVELRDGEDPQVHFIGTRPFKEDRDEFWEIAKMVCDFVKGIAPAAQSEGDPR
jgi:hypothetical protein